MFALRHITYLQVLYAKNAQPQILIVFLAWQVHQKIVHNVLQTILSLNKVHVQNVLIIATHVEALNTAIYVHLAISWFKRANNILVTV